MSFPYNTPPQSANAFMGAGFPMYSHQGLPSVGTSPPFQLPYQSHNEQEGMGQPPWQPLQPQPQQTYTGPAAVNNPAPSIQPTPPSAPAQFPHLSPCQSTPPPAPKVTETPKKEASKPIESYFRNSPPIRGNVTEPTASGEAPKAGGADTTPTRQSTA